MEHIHCNLCGQKKSKLLFKRKDLIHNVSDVEFNIVKCQNCSLVYFNPRPTQAEILAYYTDDFYNVTISKEKLLCEQEQQLQAKYEVVKDLRPGKLLDVGCNKGEFLYYMQKKGWDVNGIDFSSKPPNLFNLNIFHGNLVDAGYQPNSFNLVTLWAVLEHVYDPKSLLLEIYRILKPGGTVIVLVTNINSIPGKFMRHDDVPRHTTMFSKKTITHMLRLAGFAPIEFYFNNDIFSGSVRGVFIFLIKLLCGEKIEEIVAQNRNPNRWHEFSRQINKKNSRLMQRVDKIDIAVTSLLDRIIAKLQLGFIMTIKATKISQPIQQPQDYAKSQLSGRRGGIEQFEQNV